MPQFAANLSMLFTEVPFMARFRAAKAAGFDAVEYLFPYAYDKHALAQALKDNELIQVLHNLPPGDWDAGERGIACHPGREEEFKASVALGIEYATTLSCPRMNCLAGILPTGVSHTQARATLVRNLRYAAAELKAAKLRLVIEPINPIDIPGFFLNRTEEAAVLINDVGSDNLFIQYDIYHAQRVEGELANTIAKYLDKIDHMQLADTPGRHEPGTGEINFPWLFKHIDALGYKGHIGCEYRPLTHTDAGLHWMQKTV